SMFKIERSKYRNRSVEEAVARVNLPELHHVRSEPPD
ncbi:MAG: hypothetical protein ACI8Y6_001783, partial [Brevundimonas sp.]